jgi:acetoacetate decarboxylase
MTASQHTIAGTVLTMPVKIRKANQHNAMFAVNADAAQRLIDHSGLQVYRPVRGRAIATLILTHFIDGDLGPYYEYSTCVMVKPPAATRSRCNPHSSRTCSSTRLSRWKPAGRFGASRK